MSTPVQPSTTDLPSDPLLRPGAFIDANAQNQSAESSETPPNGSTPNGAQSETPVQGLDISPSSAESKGKRRLVPTETWLPTGWLIEDRVRSSGATAGLVDKYYVDPFSGRKFRSKKEVLYYLETGMPPPKKKKGTETSGSEDAGRGNSGGKKQKKPDKKSKPLNFDFVNMPQKVDWLLTNASEDFWIPFFGDGQVAEPTRQDWDAAFVFVTSRKTGQATH
ncbi:Detected protein of confused Function [Hibiscus syriacus]|uniref:Detected protein of confused Function n=1 Tax=Hibiscus syriacus TaxID=106335 RepID=A0A6A2WEA6_HIBSY|nr:methyl-CpG-binding domain-containing protein 5-like isoform X1 [Hibiscus syriacus]KAE8656812.1 Detected protein of confused Function [Hibiscus syriacus]